MARGSRGGGCLKITALGLVLLVVLGLLAGTVGDRFLRGEIEGRVASAMTTQLGGTTTVTIDDRSVLVGLARNRFTRISGRAPSARFSQGSGDQATTLAVSDLTFTATGVGNLRGSGPYSVDHLTAGATLTYAELSRLAGTKVTSAGGDRVKITQTASVWGASVSIEVTARPGVGSDGALTLDDPQASVSGVEVPQTLLRPLLKRITDRAELPAVQGLGYDSLTASERGIVVALSGDNVSIAR
ncbi:LmeA family phospholipid-binding protein [Aestuariimicrobium soli]|uniref:LmeA family phospholipid-binding protein n=1 Tax=Aestuariimicrobium soli TaxID=2035834 RepID=UPI003EC13D90